MKGLLAVGLGGLMLLVVGVPLVMFTGAAGALGSLAELPGGQVSQAAARDIPGNYLGWYLHWTRECPGLSWSVVAAIGKIESDHGRADLPGVDTGANAHGAAGPMQFGIGGSAGNTWATYGLDGNGDGTADVYHPADAIRSAYAYLCAHGAPVRLSDAIFAYNRTASYVRDVLAQAQQYAAAPPLAAADADATALLDNPRLRLTEIARADLERTLTHPGWIDARVLALLGALTQEHTVSVSVLRTGHSTYVRGTNRVSNHTLGRAVDIHEVDGQPVAATNRAAHALVARLLQADGPLRPDEVGSPFAEFSLLPGAFTDLDHRTHIHVGYGVAT